MSRPTLAFFFFNDTATTEIYTLSLHDALPIFFCAISEAIREHPELVREYVGSVVPYNDNFFAALNSAVFTDGSLDRKSTRLNSSHGYISYAVFSLKKKTHTPAAKAADTRRRLN